MRENKFKVWCEFMFEGELHKKMEGPESWFLLTQTGKLMTYGPGEPLQPLDEAYKVAIPLFYTGLKDKKGKELYFDDKINLFAGDRFHQKITIKDLDDLVNLITRINESGLNFEITGNINEGEIT